jgi:predicted TIM-barrel fold metal-dependent hydrolase
MSDAMDRTIHDADAHLAETPEWIRSYADPDIRDRLEARPPDPGDIEIDLRDARTAVVSQSSPTTGSDGSENTEVAEESEPEPESESESAKADKHTKHSKHSKHKKSKKSKHEPAAAVPAPEDHSHTLDQLGYDTQLIFNSNQHGTLLALEHRTSGDLDLVYGAARAHNRALVDFCSADSRLLPTGYLPLADPSTSVRFCTEVIDQGAAALLVASRCPLRDGPSHAGLEPVWTQAEEAGIPVVFHLGGGDLPPTGYERNGHPAADGPGSPAAVGGSIGAVGAAGPPMQALTTLILDGVLERFPELRFGVIDHGAAWLPSWMQQMESAMRAYCAREERLRQLTLRPSEYVRRQVRVTPHPSEDVGWVIDQVGPEICLFSSDHPVVDEQTRPVDEFERSLGDRDERVRDQFYAENFVDLMGAAMPALV